MISRRTITCLLLAAMIFLGLRLWILGHYDPCQALMPGGTTPASVMVESGDRSVEMPCEWWLPRQPDIVQILCLLDLVVMVVFGLSVWRDVNRWRNERRKLQR